MFERFTESARAAVVRAEGETRELRHEAIGCEHLLIALAAGPDDDTAVTALRRAGVEAGPLRAAVRELTAPPGPDAGALATIGIDLDEVRRRVEDAFGPGALERRRPACGNHLPFSPAAKKALELALRYAVSRKDAQIRSEHLLLGVLRAIPGDSPAACALERLGIAPDGLRALVEGPRRAA